MSIGLRYEFLLRHIFEVDAKGGDPAGLASADVINTIYDKNDVRKVRIALEYAVLAYRYKYGNERKVQDPDDMEKINGLLDELDKITEVDELLLMIQKVSDLKDYYEGLPYYD